MPGMSTTTSSNSDKTNTQGAAFSQKLTGTRTTSSAATSATAQNTIWRSMK